MSNKQWSGVASPHPTGLFFLIRADGSTSGSPVWLTQVPIDLAALTSVVFRPSDEGHWENLIRFEYKEAIHGRALLLRHRNAVLAFFPALLDDIHDLVISHGFVSMDAGQVRFRLRHHQRHGGFVIIRLDFHDDRFMTHLTRKRVCRQSDSPPFVGMIVSYHAGPIRATEMSSRKQHPPR